jgi:hypothetical protein
MIQIDLDTVRSVGKKITIQLNNNPVLTVLQT